MTENSPYLYLAPLRGITDYHFRNLFLNHFRGFNGVIAPFINPQRASSFKIKQLIDVLPENNNLPVIPQLLNIDSNDFLALAKSLEDLGYKHLNWNLGCPAPMVTRKKRGSGLLPHPEKIISLLEQVLPKLDSGISIKMRLGYESPKEIQHLLPLLNDFDLIEIIIHGRTGKQRYKGKSDPDAFDICRQLSHHTIVYNGDIVDVNSFQQLAARFSDIDRWMIGRGALADPFVGEKIKGREIEEDEKLRRLAQFHAELYEQNKIRLSGPGHLLGRMKQLWVYLRHSFPNNRKQTKKLLRSKNEKQYQHYMSELFPGYDPFSTR